MLALFDQLKPKLPVIETVKSTAPLGRVQEVLAVTAELRENGVLLLPIVAKVVEVQPFASVTVTV